VTWSECERENRPQRSVVHNVLKTLQTYTFEKQDYIDSMDWIEITNFKYQIAKLII